MLVFVILACGILESLGISIIIPLLDLTKVGPSESKYAEIMYSFLNWVGLRPSLPAVLVLLLFCFFLKSLFLGVQVLIKNHISINFYKQIFINVTRKYSQLKYEAFIGRQIGYFNNLITIEANKAVGSLNTYIQVIVTLIYIQIYVTAACLINIKLSIIVMMIAVSIFVLLRRLSSLLKKLSVRVSNTNAEIQSLAIQKIYNFKYLKATSSFKIILRQLYSKVNDIVRYQYKRNVVSEVPQVIMEPIVILTLVCFIWYYVGIRNKEIAEILVLLLFFYRALLKVLQFQSMWYAFNASIGSIVILEEAETYLDNNIELNGAVTIEGIREGLEVNNLSFKYGSKPVLHDVNISIPKNKSIGIVGPSGAGKTTIFDIFVGLLQPQLGSITVDGIDYKDLDLSSLRKLVGYVTQEPVVFNDTIANNISMWGCEATDMECMAKIDKAAKLAHCTSFIRESENGFQTNIGDKGVRLSGGQRQRISIARELFKNPQIMIFDEATSSLDSESERYVQKSIEGLSGKFTIVVIAHRLSTVRNCDYIYVLDKGKVVENGGFQELYNNKSVFYNMCKVQMI